MSGPGAGASFVFTRNGVEFAVMAQAIRGTLAAPPATPMPGSVHPLEGLVAWRGRVIPLLEPGDPVSYRGAASGAVVVASQGGELAVCADTVRGWCEARDGAGARDAAAVSAVALDPDALFLAAQRALHGGT